ncbi:proton-dependent oligopeptide transporter [Chloropicon primus]|nr:proton-dependent oligopeptide transporter [Chloropicon primus]
MSAAGGAGDPREPLIRRVGQPEYQYYGGEAVLGGTSSSWSGDAAAAKAAGYQQQNGGSSGGDLGPASSSSRKSPLTHVCPFILGNELCERLAYYGLSTNLVVYFHQVLGMGTAQANTHVNIWMGTCYVTPILGAIAADSYLGRYKTIMVFSSIYLVGLMLLAGANVAVDETNLSWVQVQLLLFVALYIIAVGTGGIKPNVSSFGADQFDENIPKQKKEKESFFNWFYLFINLGSLVASTAVVYVQQEISWTIGFLIPAVCMFLATWIFYFGRRRYVRIKPAESPIVRVLKVVFSATRKNKSVYHPGEQGAGIPQNMSYAWLESAVSSDADDSARTVEPLSPPPPSPQQGHGKRHGGKHYTHEQVEEVRLVVRLFPMFLATCFYWTVYSQMQSLFVSQGIQMNTKVSFGKFSLEIPPASLSSFDTISIIVCVPLYDRVLVPLLERANLRMTILQRIGIGLVLASISMVVAGVVEMRRLKMAREGKFTEDGSVDMSVFWQTFQYALVGASEVFASIGQLELFYDQAPDSMRSCCSALALLTTAIGGYTAGALIPLINLVTKDTKDGRWIPSNLNHGHLDYFFFVVAGLNTLGFLYYLYVAHNFKYKSPSTPQGPATKEEERDFLLHKPGEAVAIPGRRRREDSLERTPIRSLMPMKESPALPAPLR